MLWLIFDTETTGLPPKNKVISPETLQDWPYIVQFSFSLFNTDTLKIIEYDYIIYAPDIPEESTKIHGITKSMNKQLGFNFPCVYDIFKLCLDQCDLLIGHNISFDIQMLMAQCLRCNIPFTLEKPTICTMKSTTKLCNLPRMKWPNLNELHRTLFNESVINLHNSMIDVIVCLRCYYWIVYKKDLFQLKKSYKIRVPTIKEITNT
jgi:DNA polymerase III epsilon subunit-like protein